jgi:hypothetical protein
MNKFDEFMEEVQQDIRHAKIEYYWKNYGKQFLVGCALLLGASVIYTLNENRQEKLSFEASKKFVTAQNALVEGKFDDALLVFEDLTKNAPKTYQVLSLFSKVGVFFKKGTPDAISAAIESLKQIESSSFVDNDLKQFAKLLRLSHEIGNLDPKNKIFDDIRLDVDKIIKEENCWQPLAKEVKALILYRLGSFVDAAEIFISLAQDPKTPDAIRMRAQLMGQNLASKIIK